MRAYLLAVPLLLTLHNVEEVVGGMAGAREAMRARLPPAVSALVGSPGGWLFAVAVLTLVPWLLLLLNGLDRPDSTPRAARHRLCARRWGRSAFNSVTSWT